jgi:DNA-binding XRE family transcriptional regulator
MMLSMDETDQTRPAIYVAVGDRVRSSRIDKRMTQTALAAAIGLNRTSIVNIEHGKQRMLLHTLYEIAAALGLQPADLLAPTIEPIVATDLDLEAHAPDARKFVKSVISTLNVRRPQK